MLAKFISAKYKKTESVRLQQESHEVVRYFRMGYSIVQRKDGFCLMVKPAEVNAVLNINGTKSTFNLKEAICKYYRKEEISNRLFEMFCKDIEDEKVYIDVNTITNRCVIFSNKKANDNS